MEKTRKIQVPAYIQFFYQHCILDCGGACCTEHCRLRFVGYGNVTGVQYQYYFMLFWIVYIVNLQENLQKSGTSQFKTARTAA